MADADAWESPAFRALVRLLEKEPLNMRRFGVACGASPERARRVLDALEEAGLVTVARRDQGRIQVLAITLTAAGREVATHLAAARRALDRRRAPS
ncbi:MAG: hypothetical protein QOE90_3342 [Thermoplasmata archaeon]|jgi:DNA-binding MarR family transcriptional regulator|nr:hypothetical protein [Thermoplasmata archaeon]